MRTSTVAETATLGLALLSSSVNAQGPPNVTVITPSAEDIAIAANLEHFWSYGRSPPVYPTPQMAGSGDWSEAYQKARSLVGQMTNDEKNNLTYGYELHDDWSSPMLTYSKSHVYHQRLLRCIWQCASRWLPWSVPSGQRQW